ncbi:FAD-dependent oxidoreductase [Actinoallomurus sp. CA-150999]|uniref:FAD-dependent oxidoreductase n=1 Tax=Actinoallomurus sp. CA-150999 TaxID=3239887 RepID=UPI003D8D5801
MSSPAVRRVLIVGGGIAGTSLALQLQRAGIETEILEKQPVWGATGTGITLMGPALRALQRLGLLDRCLAEGTGFTEMTLFTADGDFLEKVKLHQLLGPNYPAIGGMLRPTLHRIVSEAALDRGVKVRTSASITALRQHASCVEVDLTDGTSDSYDLVVGADGWRSRVRRLLLGPQDPEPYFLGQAVWRVVLDRPAAVTGEFQFYGPGVKAGFTPLGPDRMYMFLVEPDASPVCPEPSRRPARMRELLAPFGGVVAEIRDTITDPEQIDVRPLYAVLLPAPWYRGRVLLVGDAAHATTPQLAMGGAIALEDSLVLSELLASESDLETALSTFMRRRFDRCRMVVENSVQLSEWEKSAAEHGADAARLQNESFAALAAEI